MAVIKIVPMPGPSGSGGSADIADFVFTDVDSENSSITVTGDKELTIQSGASEDLNVRAGDDLWLTADDNIFVQADDEVNLRSQGSTSILTNYVDLEGNEYVWEFGSQGYLTLPGGGEIINSPDSSGDGGGYSTLKLDPDNTLETDQYIIIDPTAPNHIHIRAGGEQDNSSTDLILGGELNNVWVSDSSRRVSINTRPAAVINSYVNDNLTSSTTFVTNNASDIIIGSVVNIGGTDYVVDAVTSNSPTEGLLSVTASGAMFTSGSTYTFVYEPPYTNYWQFGADGYLTGPAMGGLFVNGLLNGEGDLWLGSTTNVVLSTGDGEAFIDDPNNPDNQIATIGDLGVETSFTVNGGTTGTQPTFTGAPLFSGSYVKHGPMVHFQIQVDMDNITSFGTGQYYVDLPFPAKYGYQVRSGCLHDIGGEDQFAIGGHVLAGESRLYLNWTNTNGQDEAFTSTAPVTLQTNDNFHVSGDYIVDDTP
jgi:hypothetical protein